MANKSIKISIATALNAVGITAAKRAIASLASHTKDFAKAVGSNLMNIKVGFDMVASAARKFLDAMSKGMEFERMTTTFKSLTGSLELAKSHMKDLQDLGRTPPFSLEEFASASQAMMKMTGGVLGYKDILVKVGDVAAATGNDVGAMGQAVGRAYAFIRDGAPIMTAVEQLRTMGVVTQADVAAMTELQKAGADNATLWGIVEKSLEKYNGAMAETEKTAKGMVEAIQGEATVAMTDLSSAITETAKPALEGLLGFLKRINEDGTIEVWADRVVAAMNKIADVTKTLVGWFGKVRDAYGFVRDNLEKVGSFWGSYVGTLANGGSRREASKAASKGWADTEREQKARVEDAAKAEEAARKRTEDRIAKRKEEAAKAAAEAEKKMREDLERAKAETDKKRAEEAAKKAAKEDLKAQKELVEKMKKFDEERLKEQEKKTKEMIDRLLAIGADKPMQRAGGGFWGNGTMDQAGDLRNERQAKIDEARFQKAVRAAGGDKALENLENKALENLEKKLNSGKRLSNLERATLDRLRLDQENKRAKKLQEDRDKLQERMAGYMKDIDDRMKVLGL